MEPGIHLKKWQKQFFTIIFGQAVSLIGSSAVQFSLIWWLASSSGSAMVMATSGLFAFVPLLVLGPFVGVFIDRHSRKKIVIFADLFQGLAALVFAAAFLLGEPPYYIAWVVLGLRSVGNAFHSPSIQSIMPLLVPPEELTRANGWSQFMSAGAFMLGPVLGAAMYASLPMPLILVTDMVGALAACGTMLSVKVPELKKEREEAPRFFHEMREGAAVLLRERPLFAVLMFSAASMIFYMPLSSYYPLMTSDFFKLSAWHGSLAEFLYALGMLLSSALMGLAARGRNKIFGTFAGIFGIGAMSILAGVLPPEREMFYVFAAACFVIGAAGNIFNIFTMSYVQSSLPPESLGRVFSLIMSGMSATMPIGLALSGPLAETHGVNFWFFVSGIAIVVISSIGYPVCAGLQRKFSRPASAGEGGSAPPLG